MQALRFMRREEVAALEPTLAAQNSYNEDLQEKLGSSVWVQGGCSSWYLDAQGRNTTLWPGWASGFRRTLRRFDPALYTARREGTLDAAATRAEVSTDKSNKRTVTNAESVT